MSSSPVVLLTGASKGIGLAVARVLLQSAARVVGVGRSDLQSSSELAALVKENPASFHYLPLDITDAAAASTLVDAALSTYGRLDAVIHNAGLIDPIATIAEADLSAWKKCMDVNLFGCIALLQKALPHLRTNEGRFILVSSGAAIKPYQGWLPYCVSKSACNMLVAGLGLEEQKVISIALRPGVVDTEMQTLIRESGRGAMGDASHDRFVELKETGKLLPPEVPGHVIAKLALGAPKELSGQFISWDDGRLAAYQKK